MKPPLLLVGRKAGLRAPEAKDLPALHRLRNDVESQLMLMSLPRGSSMEKTRDWTQRMSSDPHTLFLVIVGRNGTGMKGYIQITQIDTLHGHGELGICIAPEARGQGFGTEALLLIEAHASRLFDLRKITLRVFASHKPAIALYTKGGYSEVGVLREHFYQNNHRHDVLIMEKSLGSPSRSK